MSYWWFVCVGATGLRGDTGPSGDAFPGPRGATGFTGPVGPQGFVGTLHLLFHRYIISFLLATAHSGKRVLGPITAIPSLCLSVAFWYCTQMNEDRIITRVKTNRKATA